MDDTAIEIDVLPAQPEDLAVLPEYQIALDGGIRPSQTDVFVLGRRAAGLVTIAVEGKVDEPFGPTISERRAEGSPGVKQRIASLVRCLGLPEVPGPHPVSVAPPDGIGRPGG